MWYKNETNNYGHCFARTLIEVERRSYMWNLRQFCSFQESVCEIASASAEQSIISLKFFSSSGQNSETFICVETELIRKKNCYFPNDALQLYYECDIATGIVLETKRKLAMDVHLRSRKEILLVMIRNKKKMHLNSTRILKENRESCY
ncbi:hypothetical protein TNIN_17011 [Trichonephila inaurata madagascariensis]|uniref:Uncharacterized protein n=1 Tax=Trichonephila inaurata madagascariensis TaxID=2747483 RepID=A0A8X6YR48_9ARAC|nr:hypothetical protein TNIN_17011 [Trichonephila inaurata madagascariensis]